MANFFKATTAKKALGQQLKLTVERLDHNGLGVAQSKTRFKNKAIFIAGALPDEDVEIKIIEQKNKYLRGKLITINKPSPQRVQPLCHHYLLCGGCDLQHLALSEQLKFKQQKISQLFARNKINITLPWQAAIESSPWHYRRKARLGVQYDKAGQITLGFRQKSTNALTAIKQCPVLVEPLAEIFVPLKKVLNQLTLSQSVGHIEVIYSQFITLVIRQLKTLNNDDKMLWLQFAKQIGGQIVIDDGNSVFPLGEQRDLDYSLPITSDESILPAVNISFSVKDFIQVNADVNTKMVNQAIDWLALEADDTVLDLFCGLGNFTLPIAKQVKKVVAIEGVKTMVDRAAVNAKKNHLSHCEFYQADLNSPWKNFSWAQQAFDKVLLDPARAGAFEAIEQLIIFDQQHNRIGKILYVSCDPATLAKDSQLLLSYGFKIEKIALMDMFCQTKHVETMVVFTR